jgi:hypothetical protein
VGLHEIQGQPSVQGNMPVSSHLPTCCCSSFLHCFTLQPWRWRWYVPLKLKAVSELHDVTTQKFAFISWTWNNIGHICNYLWLGEPPCKFPPVRFHFIYPEITWQCLWVISLVPMHSFHRTLIVHDQSEQDNVCSNVCLLLFLPWNKCRTKTRRW